MLAVEVGVVIHVVLAAQVAAAKVEPLTEFMPMVQPDGLDTVAVAVAAVIVPLVTLLLAETAAQAS